ncbi:MAG: ABC transporter permease, partial [Candidatus Eiseniibacteriota bacterium]
MLSSISYLAREGLRSSVRYPGLTLAAVLSMSASLLVLGLFIVFTSNVERAAATVEERKLIDVYLVDGIDPAALAGLGQRLGAIDGVAGLRYISKQEALESFTADSGRYDLVEELGHNPLPASFRVELDEDSRASARMRAIAGELAAMPEVEDVRYGGEWVERLESVLFSLRVADLVMGLLVGLSASFVIGSTIRLAVLARQEMVEIMRVVGATDVYIRTPFVIEGIVQSLVAGALTLVVLRIIVGALSPRVGGIEFLGPLGVLAFLAFAAL